MFPAGQRPKHGVWVSYQYGFAADLGGGEYAAARPELEHATRYVVHTACPTADGEAGLAAGAFRQHRRRARRPGRRRRLRRGPQQPRRALDHRVGRKRRVRRQHRPAAGAGEAIQLRAAERTRPVLRLLDVRASQPDALSVSGGAGSRAAARWPADRGARHRGAGPDRRGERCRNRREDLCELRDPPLHPGAGLGAALRLRSEAAGRAEHYPRRRPAPR